MRAPVFSPMPSAHVADRSRVHSICVRDYGEAPSLAYRCRDDAECPPLIEVPCRNAPLGLGLIQRRSYDPRAQTRSLRCWYFIVSFVEGLVRLKRVEHQTVKAAVHHFVDRVLMRFNNDHPQGIIARELVANIQYVFAEG